MRIEHRMMQRRMQLPHRRGIGRVFRSTVMMFVMHVGNEENTAGDHWFIAVPFVAAVDRPETQSR